MRGDTRCLPMHSTFRFRVARFACHAAPFAATRIMPPSIDGRRHPVSTNTLPVDRSVERRGARRPFHLLSKGLDHAR